MSNSCVGGSTRSRLWDAQLPVGDARREVDIDLLAVVEIARRIAAANRLTEADALKRPPGIDWRDCLRGLRLALQGQHPISRIVPAHRRHPGAFGQRQFQQVRPAADDDDQIRLQPATDRLDQYIDTQRVADAAGRVADDSAHGIAGGDRHQFIAGLEPNQLHLPQGRHRSTRACCRRVKGGKGRITPTRLSSRKKYLYTSIFYSNS